MTSRMKSRWESPRDSSLPDIMSPSRFSFGKFRRGVLLFLFLLTGIFAVWVGIEMILANRQRSVVERIWQAGGYIQREYPRERDARMVWYRVWLGEDFMNPVFVVRLAGASISDSDLKYIARLRGLRMLDLRDTQITDSGLRYLRHLKYVEVLIATGTSVTDSGLLHLTGMDNLKVLCLEETRVTDEGLSLLGGFPKLGWINLSNSQVSGEGLNHLLGCSALETLILDPSEINEETAMSFRRSAPSVHVYSGTQRRPPFHPFAYEHLMVRESDRAGRIGMAISRN